MKFGTIFPILAAGIIHLNSGLGAPVKPITSVDNSLPWHVIAKEYLKANIYTCRPNQLLIINLQGQTGSIKYPPKTNVNIDKYINDSWCNIDQIQTNIKDGKIKIEEGFGEEGFFKLSCPLKIEDGTSFISESYIIICSNWKKDILTFCRKLKEQIEMNPDPQLIRSTMAISHFDYVKLMFNTDL